MQLSRLYSGAGDGAGAGGAGGAGVGGATTSPLSSMSITQSFAIGAPFLSLEIAHLYCAACFGIVRRTSQKERVCLSCLPWVGLSLASAHKELRRSRLQRDRRLLQQRRGRERTGEQDGSAGGRRPPLRRGWLVRKAHNAWVAGVGRRRYLGGTEGLNHCLVRVKLACFDDCGQI